MGHILLLFSILILSLNAFAQSPFQARPERMESRIRALGKFGANPQGGVSRVAFSEADKQGRAFIIGLMKSAGLVVHIDAAGNIIGKRAGKNPLLQVIAFGSHIDSVPFGGNYDGDVGVIGAIECIELLNEAGLITEHPLEVIAFSDEEGGLTGSTAMIGRLKENNLNQISSSGKTVREGLSELGGDIAKLPTAIRQKGELLAFLELHIEQGAILYNSKIDVGIVEGIVGIEQWDVTIEGRANHAGTTPMNLRKDAMLAAAKLIIAVNESVKSIPGAQVGTVGRIKTEPGAPNVIPGKVTMSVELRDLSREKILSVFEKIKQRAAEIEKESGTHIDFTSAHSNLPAITDKKIQLLIETAARELGLSYKLMPSGAGHDTQDLAVIAPTGMIFVPSKDGISHSPDEYSSPNDMANGVTVLLRTILALDRQK